MRGLEGVLKWSAGLLLVVVTGIAHTDELPMLDEAEALRIYIAADREAAAVGRRVREREGDRAAGFAAYERAYSAAVIMELREEQPEAPAEALGELAAWINAGRMLADSAVGAAQADFEYAQVVNQEAARAVMQDRAEAFTLGFRQARRRAGLIMSGDELSRR